MASPLCDPLRCDEQPQEWDSGAEGGAPAWLPGRAGSPTPLGSDDDSDGDGSASEDEDLVLDTDFWSAKLAGQAALQPETDYPDWHPVVGAAERQRLVNWLGRVRSKALRAWARARAGRGF